MQEATKYTNQPFLWHVARNLLTRYGNDLSGLTIVFPNKRASLFFNEHLASLSSQPVWSPSYTTISDLFRKHSNLSVPDDIKLICDLHRSFCTCTGRSETLDKFLGWGVVLLNDFNDIAESGELIETVTRWSTEYEANICNVLHENKSKEDTNMRGHLGTELVNKCADVWQVTKDAKDKTRFTVEQTESRNAPVDDFAMKREDDGTITIDPGTDKGVVYSKKAFDTILEQTGSRRYNELKNDYMELTGVTEKTARNHMDRALADGYLDKNNGLFYKRRNDVKGN